MKKLISYMKDALINSYDTLIEAYETCHVLKLIEKLLKQNNNSHLELINENRNNSFINSIQQYLNDDNLSTSSSSSSSSASASASSSDNDEVEEEDADDKRSIYVDEQMQILKYKQDMENLMNTLDDIEVQYLQRKDQMQKKSKLFYQLKSKIKSIENKFDSLSKEVNNLKYESCVYKDLLEEKLPSKILLPATVYENKVSLLATREQDRTSSEDYNRKLNLISNLINLHKNKNSYCNRKNQQQNSIQINNNKKTLNYHHYPTTLNLYECTCDGDLVTIENCDFKLDHDLSDWIITRQIDNMSSISYRIPSGSICKSGKVLSLKTLFNDQLNFLYAIQKIADNSSTNKNISIRINTKLISPNGQIISSHTQEIPQFYQEIFKYANLIGFF